MQHSTNHLEGMNMLPIKTQTITTEDGSEATRATATINGKTIVDLTHPRLDRAIDLAKSELYHKLMTSQF